MGTLVWFALGFKSCELLFYDVVQGSDKPIRGLCTAVISKSVLRALVTDEDARVVR